MEPNVTLLLVAGFLIACGVYLFLERSLTRILIGILLASNGVNLLYPIIAGPARLPAFIGVNPRDRITDPLPQAMVLTSIVITLATTAFLLTMAYRAFQVNGHDEVQDDIEDAVIRRLALLDEASESYDAGAATGEPGEEAGSDVVGDRPAPVTVPAAPVAGPADPEPGPVPTTTAEQPDATKEPDTTKEGER